MMMPLNLVNRVSMVESLLRAAAFADQTPSI